MRKSVKKLSFALLAVLSLLVSWVIFGTNIAVSQQVADPNFDSSVAYPAYTTNAPRVLFDEAHLNFHTTQGRYKPFVDLISNDGYRVVPNKKLFQAEVLQNYNILVIANASSKQEGQPAISDRECDIVKNWVRSGGSLLLIADHKPFGAAVQNLATRFDVKMSNKFTVDLSNYDKESGVFSFLLFNRQNGLLANHPITQGQNSSEQVNKIMTFTGQSLSVPPQAKALLSLSNSAIDLDDRLTKAEDLRFKKGTSASCGAQAIALSVGKGRVVILGEAGMISAQLIKTPDKNAFPMGMNHPGLDNKQFALNLMHWLSRLLNES